MAEDEKTDSAGSVTADSTRKTHEGTAHKAGHKSKVKRPAAAKKVATHAAPGLVTDNIKEPTPADSGFPLLKLLAGVVILSVILNGYLLMQNIQLGKDLDAAKNSYLSSGQTITGETSGNKQPTGQKPAAGAVKLDFYVMSHCPYGIQVLDGIAPALKSLGNSIDFTVNYIATDGGNGQFTSLHGQTEVDDDKRELCAMKYYPDSYQWMDFVACRDKNAQSTDWQSCATSNGMDADKLKTCAEGDEGSQLLSASIQASNTAQASGSPTMFLNGKSYNGGRKTSDFMRAVCDAMSVKAAACSDIPAPAKFNIVIVNDNRCKDCDTKGMEARLLQMFPGGVIKNLDYSSAEGKKMYDATGIKTLPAILMDQKVKQDSGYSDISKYLSPAGDYLNLLIGSKWDPYCDPDNSHCSEDKCKGRMSCRQETPKKLDVFVMSHCPFGIQALNAMKDVQGAIKDLSFSVHYIADYDETSGKFNSLHGQTEVDDNLREICAMKYYPDTYMNFIWCRNKDTNGDWQKCFTDNGMDAAKIKACAEGDEGKNLLKEDIKIAQDLGIGGSPTWLANNKYQFSGVTAAAISQGLCAHNSGLAGCDQKLSGDSGGVPANGGCG